MKDKNEPIDERRFSSSLVPMSWHYEQMENIEQENEKLRSEVRRARKWIIGIAIGGLIVSLTTWAITKMG